MGERPLLGLGRHIVPVPWFLWRRRVAGQAPVIRRRLAFMSAGHHQVRDFVVRELPRVGEPLTPESIAKALHLSVNRVTQILDELERRMVFLFRNDGGAVVWAYPATAAATPHHAAFSSGERLDAA